MCSAPLCVTSALLACAGPAKAQAERPDRPEREGTSVPPNPAEPARPRELPYSEGAVVPTGYHVETPPRWWLVGSGGLLFSVGYGFALWGTTWGDGEGKPGDPGYVNHHYLAVPLIGPALTLSSWTPDRDLPDSNRLFERILIADMLVQATGTAMIVVGLVWHRPTLVGDTSLTWTITPVMCGRGLPGVGVTGQF